MAAATWITAALEAVHQFFTFVSSFGVSWVGQVVHVLAKDWDKEFSDFGTPVHGRRVPDLFPNTFKYRVGKCTYLVFK